MDVLTTFSERCEKLRTPGPINLIVSIFILVGLLISYLPQHYRIISRGSSEGISPYFVLLGVTSATSGFANILTLPQSRQDVACCKDLDTFHCLAGLLGIAQLGVQWICFAFILVLFLVFFRYGNPELLSHVEEDDEEHRIEPVEAPGWQTAVMVACVCFLHGLIVIIVTAVMFYIFPGQLSTWANSLGLMAALLAAVQYIPQIWTTYRLKHVGSLSIPMMCIQTPGGFLFAGSLFARLGWPGWSSWGIFLLTAAMQGMLLTLGVYYEIRRARAAEEEQDLAGDPDTNGDADEHTPLVGAPANGRREASSSNRKGWWRRAGAAAGHTAANSRGVPGHVDARGAAPARHAAHPAQYGNTPAEVQVSSIGGRQEADASSGGT